MCVARTWQDDREGCTRRGPLRTHPAGTGHFYRKHQHPASIWDPGPGLSWPRQAQRPGLQICHGEDSSVSVILGRFLYNYLGEVEHQLIFFSVVLGLKNLNSFEWCYILEHFFCRWMDLKISDFSSLPVNLYYISPYSNALVLTDCL